MVTKSIGKVKLATDKTTGKVKLTRVHAYDASKVRKIAKSKAKRVVARGKSPWHVLAGPIKIVARKGKKKMQGDPNAMLVKREIERRVINFEYLDLTGRKPMTVKATRAA